MLTRTAERAPRDTSSPVRQFHLEDVAFDIGGRQILSPLTLDIDAGCVNALIGPNGSGKSTLVKLLARQISPTIGRIEFEGRPIGCFGNRDFARRLGYLPQTPPTTEGMTVRELVELGRYPWHGALGRQGETDRAAIDEAIALTGAEALRGRLVEELSGGERQRVWLAMLIAQGARCLVLDEPTSALDVAHQAEMLHLVRRLSKDRDLSVVIVLHDINMAARTCDRLIALKAGKIVASGKPDAIMRPDVLEAIYDVPMGVFRQPGSEHVVAYVV